MLPAAIVSFSVIAECLELFAQIIADVTSTYMTGMAELRYEAYVATTTIQRTKDLVACLNRTQRDGIKKLLQEHGSMELMELIDPILSITATLRQPNSERKYLDAEIQQISGGAVVTPVSRSLGKVSRRVKVSIMNIDSVQ